MVYMFHAYPTLPNDIMADHIVPKVMELIMQVKAHEADLGGNP